MEDGPHGSLDEGQFGLTEALTLELLEVSGVSVRPRGASSKHWKVLNKRVT